MGFSDQTKTDGIVEHHQACLVVQGNNQAAGVNFFDTFSPVVKPSSIPLVLSIAVSRGWMIRQLDVNNVFLNGDLQETIYMTQPLGFRDSSELKHVCLLLKALYGFKQAPPAQFYKLRNFLLQQDFKACYSDSSLFEWHVGTSLTYIMLMTLL